MKAKKISIGLRTARTMLRIPAIGGQVMDTIMKLQRSHNLGDDFFTAYSMDRSGGWYRLSNKEKSKHLFIDPNQIIFTHDFYDDQSYANVDGVIRDFKILYGIANKVIEFDGIRRIGIVAEFREPVATGNPSALLAEKLTNIGDEGYSAKFQLNIERRILPASKTGIPDINTDDFINVIEQYYASELDSEYPDPDSINLNLDVQRYFTPLLAGKIESELSELQTLFQKRSKIFVDSAVKRGLMNRG